MGDATETSKYHICFNYVIFFLSNCHMTLFQSSLTSASWAVDNGKPEAWLAMKPRALTSAILCALT